MIKNEQHLKQECMKTALWGCLIAFVASILLKRMAIFGGYVLGVLVASMVLHIDCEAADGILKSKINRPYLMTMLFYFLKLGIYALGFLAAVKIPVIFNLFSVFVGYLNTKVTIYRLTLARR